MIKKGYKVHGLKETSLINTDRIDHLFQEYYEPRRNLILHHGDLTDSNIHIKNNSRSKTDEIYNLAAQSHVAVSFEEPEYTANTDALGSLRI